MLWLLFPLMAMAKFDGSNVTCPKGLYSEIGQTPIIRLKNNLSHILVCGKQGKKIKEDYYLTEFEVYYYHPAEKRLMPKLITTQKNERYRVYQLGQNLFLEELAYNGAKRVPVFRNSISCSDTGKCSLASLECVFDKKKSSGVLIPASLKTRLEKARCL